MFLFKVLNDQIYQNTSIYIFHQVHKSTSTEVSAQDIHNK